MDTHPFSLQGMTALVVGGTAGIGRAAAEAFVALGAEVAVAGRNQVSGEQAAAEMGARYFRLDVRDAESVDHAVACAMRGWDRLDIAVNAAGLGLNKPTEEIEDAEFAQVVDVNLGGVFRCCRAEGRAMFERGSGSIVNIASMSASVVNHPQKQAVYNAAKAAVVHFTRSLAVEWCDRGIRVNSVSPGYTETAMTARGRSNPDVLASWIAKTPLRRVARPAEMAGAIAYLASNASSYATGTDIVVDGGYQLW